MINNLIKRLEAGKSGSALIMTIVLTVLLAAIGVMFVAVARMDRASTSNIADNKTIDLAAKSIIEIISKDLVYDTPGIAKQAGLSQITYPQYFNYYDYPDANNPWLASLEPYQKLNDPNYRWPQISDVTGYLRSKAFLVQDVNVKPKGLSTYDVVREYPIFGVDANGNFLTGSTNSIAKYGVSADADGDGIADSKWIELTDLHSSKGKKIYAAIRVIDNGAMVNVNTAHTFNPESTDANKIDGSTQMQVNFKGLLKGTPAQINTQIADFNQARCGSDSGYWSNYEKNVIWHYGEPKGNYLPFDISDELELRYRYCIDSKFISRFECKLRNTADAYGDPGGLYDTTGTGWGLDYWKIRITDPNDPNTDRDRRHFLTTYNYDRVIDPCGHKMININNAAIEDINSAIREGLYDAGMNHSDANKVAAQLAVNVKDYRDSDSDVNWIDVDGKRYYGFEAQPFISEIAAKIDATDPNNKSYYALELYNPFNIAVPLDDFILSISDGNEIALDGNIPAYSYYVISNDPNKFIIDSGKKLITRLKFSGDYVYNSISGTFVSWSNYNLKLKRKVGLNKIVLDVQNTDKTWFPAPATFYGQRDPNNWRIVYQNMNSVGSTNGTLGKINKTTISGANYNLSLANKPFITVGDIARPLIIGPNTTDNGIIGNQLLLAAASENNIRLDLTNQNYQQIFKYLTVFDPHNFVSDVKETRVKGRININTAPEFVIAQLPWVSLRKGGYNDPNLAKAIIAYRDKTGIDANCNYAARTGAAGFVTIGQLMKVNASPKRDYDIDYYAKDSNDLKGFPDLDEQNGDGVGNDFEERDLIFSRISNLVTVRSDVFTAYILVRIGVDGPQKRYIVILDRSEVTPTNKKVKIAAFQFVPEAR